MNDRELFRLAPKQKITRFGSKNCHTRKKTYNFRVNFSKFLCSRRRIPVKCTDFQHFKLCT